MRLLDAKWIGILGLALALGTTGIGCGDDDDSGAGDGGPDGGNIDGGGGGAGSGGSTGGKKDSGTDSGTKSGGTGGTTGGGSGGTTAIPMGATCDTSIKTSATCGSKTCGAATSQLATFVCSAGCCLSGNTCGTRRAIKGAVTDCAAPATADTSCPDYMGMGAGMMTTAADAASMMYPGCCAPSGKCGIISTIDMTCITSSPLLTDLKPGAACGEVEDGGANDGG
jgi:hypothetical protein